MFEDNRSEKEATCLCMGEESTGQLVVLTEPVELDDADLDAVVGGVLCCSCSSSFVRGASPSCCSN